MMLSQQPQGASLAIIAHNANDLQNVEVKEPPPAFFVKMTRIAHALICCALFSHVLPFVYTDLTSRPF